MMQGHTCCAACTASARHVCRLRARLFCCNGMRHGGPRRAAWAWGCPKPSPPGPDHQPASAGGIAARAESPPLNLGRSVPARAPRPAPALALHGPPLTDRRLAAAQPAPCALIAPDAAVSLPSPLWAARRHPRWRNWRTKTWRGAWSCGTRPGQLPACRRRRCLHATERAASRLALKPGTWRPASTQEWQGPPGPGGPAALGARHALRRGGAAAGQGGRAGGGQLHAQVGVGGRKGGSARGCSGCLPVPPLAGAWVRCTVPAHVAAAWRHGRPCCTCWAAAQLPVAPACSFLNDKLARGTTPEEARRLAQVQGSGEVQEGGQEAVPEWGAVAGPACGCDLCPRPASCCPAPRPAGRRRSWSRSW